MDFGKLDQEGLNMLHDTETLWTKGDESITLPYKIPRRSSKLHLNVLALLFSFRMPRALQRDVQRTVEHLGLDIGLDGL